MHKQQLSTEYLAGGSDFIDSDGSGSGAATYWFEITEAFDSGPCESNDSST